METIEILIVVFFLLGDSSVSEFYLSTFWNTVFSIFIGSVRESLSIYHLWRWNRVFWNISTYNSDAGESPKRKNTTFSTHWKFEIKNVDGYLPVDTVEYPRRLESSPTLLWEPWTWWCGDTSLIQLNLLYFKNIKCHLDACYMLLQYNQCRVICLILLHHSCYLHIFEGFNTICSN